MGEVGRVVQAAVSRKRPKQREKWVPKPEGARRGSGRTRSAAREEAVRPLLQIVELHQTRGDLLEPWTLSAYVAQWNRTCRDAAVAWRTEATEMKLVGMPGQGDIQAGRIAIGPCLSFGVFQSLARNCQQLRVLELNLAEEPENGDDSALVALVRRCPLRRIWFGVRTPAKRCSRRLSTLPTPCKSCTFPCTWQSKSRRSNPSRGGARISRCSTSEINATRAAARVDDAVQDAAAAALARNPCRCARFLNIDRTEVQDAAAAACVTARTARRWSHLLCSEVGNAIGRCAPSRVVPSCVIWTSPDGHSNTAEIVGSTTRERAPWSSRAVTSRTFCSGVTAPKLRTCRDCLTRCGRIREAGSCASRCPSKRIRRRKRRWCGSWPPRRGYARSRWRRVAED